MTVPGLEPPPVGGILWSVAGEVRALLGLPAALTLQVAHPAVGAGVAQYSVFRTDPWGRAERSLRSSQLWVYGSPAEAAEEGRRLRRLHQGIQGVDAHGRPYRALDPACYAWVHATGFPILRQTQRYLGRRPFTRAEERQLYADWLRVGRVLGLGGADLPGTVEDFWAYYRTMLAGGLEATAVVRELTSCDAPVPPPDRGPLLLRLPLRACWPVLRRHVGRLRGFLAVGLLPSDARAAIGLPWTARQERRLRLMGRCTAAVVPLLPERLRYLPRARAARRAVRSASGGRTPGG
jgi:uncharacterized protein (DUF2236 family)